MTEARRRKSGNRRTADRRRRERRLRAADMLLNVVILLSAAVLAFRVMGLSRNALALQKETRSALFIGTGECSEDYTPARCVETLLLFREEIWQGMTLAEKGQAAQVLANIEARRLGLPHALNVAVCEMNEIQAGFYRDAQHRIAMNADSFDYLTAEQVMRIIFHEAYHAYQYRISEAYETVPEQYRSLKAFSHAKEYHTEFRDYVSVRENAEAYRAQLCEIDADIYAEEELEQMLNFIRFREGVY